MLEEFFDLLADVNPAEIASHIAQGNLHEWCDSWRSAVEQIPTVDAAEVVHGMNKIPYDRRVQTYSNALIHFGKANQLIVALEELSECQKEICKVMRGESNLSHLAEEIADAIIMLEQVQLIFSVEDLVCAEMDRKVQRLDDKLREEAYGG